MPNSVLYLDNFRGFKDTYIPLEDVNFFVGENSVGKTSVLKVLNFLSGEVLINNRFIFLHRFSNLFENITSFFGSYDEITTEEYFKLGIELGEYALLFKVKQEKNIPIIEEIRYLTVDFGKKKSEKVSKNDFVLINMNNKTVSKIEIDNGKVKNGLIRILNSVIITEKNTTKLNNEEIRTIIHVRLRNSMFSNTLLFDPIRAEPLRTYDTYLTSFNAKGNHFPYMLKTKTINNASESQDFIDAINQFGQESGLFKKIEVNAYTNNHTSPFEILVELENGLQVKYQNVGYGVPQIMPIIGEICADNKGITFLLQQPEVHLHPKAQAAFGKFLYQIVKLRKHYIIVETHSDFIIDRFRLTVNNDDTAEKPSSQVVFFKREGNTNTATAIKINPNGTYADEIPEGLRDFFVNEAFDLLKL